MWKRWLGRLSRIASRPPRDWLLIAQVVALLGVTRLLINVLTFSRLERFLGERLAESPTDIPVDEQVEAKRIRRVIRRVSPHTPWNSNCFPQAVTARLLLQRRRISSTLYLGARFGDDKNELLAHAWLRSGQIYVTGGDGSKKYGAIAAFA